MSDIDTQLDDFLNTRYGMGAAVPSNPEELRLAYHAESKAKLKAIIESVRKEAVGASATPKLAKQPVNKQVAHRSAGGTT